MPLHLLGKKSWNVYNAENIARVKQDEAEAAAREAADEQRMQEVDAERRLQILRGVPIEELPVTEDREPQKGSKEWSAKHDTYGRERKRRRIAGEDDTERDIRFAQETTASEPAKKEIKLISKKSSNAPLTDHKGNINLFPVEQSKYKSHKNGEVEAEKKRREKEFEDQYTMRFSNAAGFKQSIGEKPWYQSLGAEKTIEAPSKDIWGNEDPGRKERQSTRVASEDPLAIMKKGVFGVREVEQERRRWKQEKVKEMRAMDDEERRERKRRRRRETGAFDGFSLDNEGRSHKETEKREKSLSRHHHGRSNLSREGYRHHPAKR